GLVLLLCFPQLIPDKRMSMLGLPGMSTPIQMLFVILLDMVGWVDLLILQRFAPTTSSLIGKQTTRLQKVIWTLTSAPPPQAITVRHHREYRRWRERWERCFVWERCPQPPPLSPPRQSRRSHHSARYSALRFAHRFVRHFVHCFAPHFGSAQGRKLAG